MSVRNIPPSLKVGDGITTSPSGWSFGGPVSRVFDQHVKRSIPYYDQIHGVLLDAVGPGPGRVYELGSATGVLAARLATRYPELEVVGIDAEPDMVATARRLHGSERVRFLQADLRELEFEPCRAVISCLTLQFVPPSLRRDVLARAVRALEPGGVFALVEKVAREELAWQREGERLLELHKRRQGFTPEQIAAKAKAIHGVLEPLTDEENEKLLGSVGLSEIRLVFRYANFDGWVGRRTK